MRASGYDRAANDWYVEPASCVEALLAVEMFRGTSWDPSCGGGNIPTVMRSEGLTCVASDIVDRGYLGATVQDFLKFEGSACVDNIVTNPPFGIIEKYISRALDVATDKVAILARLALLEGAARQGLLRASPLARVWVSSQRISMPPGGSKIQAKNGSVAYAWFVFEHGHGGRAEIDHLPLRVVQPPRSISALERRAERRSKAAERQLELS